MKRTIAILGLCAAFVISSGCHQPNDPSPRNVHELIDSAGADGLTVRVKVPKAFYLPGQIVNVEVTAVNNTSEAIDIQSRSSALVKADVRTYDGVRWKTVKTFPEAAAMVITPWTLEPGQSRTFPPLSLEISKDWPTAETLRLRGWINGREDLKPTVEIRIVPEASPLPDTQ
jgi:hypothetical protein